MCRSETSWLTKTRFDTVAKVDSNANPVDSNLERTRSDKWSVSEVFGGTQSNTRAAWAI